MKIEFVTKSEFDFLKDNLVEWLYKKLDKDSDTIFHFSSDLTPEDRKYIYQNSDNFKIEKNKIIEIDNFEKVEKISNTVITDDEITDDKITEDDKINNDSEIKYEIIMKAGRKYYTKLQRYPIQTMGIINVINNKIDTQMKLITYILIVNSCMFFYVLNKS